MKQYKGALNSETEKRIKANMQAVKGILNAPLVALGRSSSSITSIDETIKKYNPGITKDEIVAWVWYRKSLGIPMTNWSTYHVKMTPSYQLKLVQNGVLFYDAISKSLVPLPVFTFGNIYKKLAALTKSEQEVVKNYGQSIYSNHIAILEDIKPEPLSLQNPMQSERPVILAISETARTFTISGLRPDTGVILAEPTDLQDAYTEWLRNLPEDQFKKTRAYEVINYYIGNASKPRSIDKIEWGAIKKITRDEGERLFKIFLHEALERADQIKLDALYNSQYNATAPLQYQKIPIGIEVSRKFMSFDLDIRPAQREGIAFMELVGSGIIAYDVGVGKTITAIIEVASAINNGKCKRPVIVVPNPTYKNWIKEMIGDGDLKGILSGTNITLNEWFNLGVDYDGLNFEKAVPERSITLLTYEGLNKIGFNEHTQNDHFMHLSNILGQSESGTERETAKENEKYREIIGVGLKETIADIETLGFDYIVVDEAHNYKNVFSQVKSDKNAGKQFMITGGQPSNRAIKLFFLCNYIQRTYGKNVMLLTATPFTNSPLEIYSMLSFVSYDYMRKNGILNIRQFFEQYIQETSEYVVGVDGEIKQKNVVKSFNNRISLQKLINSHINFKTGEEANIPRPCKINLPKTSVLTDDGLTKLNKNDQILTYLKLTDAQQSNQLEINSEASKGASKDDPGKLLRLMSRSLNNALSPFLYYNSEGPKDYVDFVENSPKILYTLECVREVKEFHENRNEPISGQVIYIDRGKDYFPLIKQYLENQLGYKKNQKLISNPRLKVDEVEIITGGISTAKKEKIKDAFNEGVCKIIIGTSTIKEGINLQVKSTVLYNLYPNWNPTDIRQLEGRIWRQKNEFGYVRIVMPLMENSMDVFVFQKLDEKTSRINDLWNKSDRGNVLDEESLDPNEVKFALVTDLDVLVRFEKKQIKEELSAKTSILTKQIQDIDTYSDLVVNYNNAKEKIINSLELYHERFSSQWINAGSKQFSFRDVPSIDLENETKEVVNTINRYNSVYESLGEIAQGDHTDKTLIKVFTAYKRLTEGAYFYDYPFIKFKDYSSQLAKLKRSLFTQRGYDETTDIQKIKLELAAELEESKIELEDLNSQEFDLRLRQSISEQKKKYEIKGGDLDSRVKDFASLNNLLSYKFSDVDHTSCIIPTKLLPPKSKSASKVNKGDKAKRLKLAKAKAKALKLKLLLA